MIKKLDDGRFVATRRTADGELQSFAFDTPRAAARFARSVGKATTDDIVVRERQPGEFEVARRIVPGGILCERLGWVCMRHEAGETGPFALWEAYPDHHCGGPVSMLAATRDAAVDLLVANAAPGTPSRPFSA